MLCSCNLPYGEYKGVNHRGNCTKNKLCNDIDKNPFSGMNYVVTSKTIKAPYIMDVVVFRQHAGQQCVAMSLCALIDHNMEGKYTSDIK